MNPEQTASGNLGGIKLHKYTNATNKSKFLSINKVPKPQRKGFSGWKITSGLNLEDISCSGEAHSCLLKQGS